MAPVLFVSLFLLPLTARAEIKGGSFEVTPFAGYNFFESKQNLENRPVFGGRLGYNITSHFGIEATGEYIKSRVDDRSRAFTKEGQFTSPHDGVDITMYHLDLVYHFMPEGNFNPFIVAGYGAAHYSPKISNKNMSVIDFGLGAKYWLADHVALRVDVRDNMVTETFQESYHNVEATLGIVVAFGGSSKAASAPVAKNEPAVTPEPTPPPPQAKPRTVEKVIILASEPKVEEKVVAVVSETKTQEKVVFLAFEDVHFDFDKSTLKPEAQAILKRNIQLLKENPKAQIRIAGYTSASGTEAYNQKLSERRANAVKAYLVSEGVIKSDRLSTIGYGETHPAVYEAAPEELYSSAAKANMRVLFEIIVQ
jgi:OOP family OmpA-OmpF porin